jgi:hypothetical protein
MRNDFEELNFKRKKFLRPNLGLKLGDFQYFECFCQKVVQKVKKIGKIYKCGPETNLG